MTKLKPVLIPIVSSAVTAAVVGIAVVSLMKPSAPPPAASAADAAAHGEAAAEDAGGHGGGHGEAAAEDAGGHGGGHGESDAEPSKVKHTGNYYQYDSFVVSVFDREKVHYLRIKVALELSSSNVKEEIDLKDPQIKDSMIFVLGDFTVRELLDNQAKLLVKEVLMKTLNKILGKGKVIDIYFTEFVVQ